MKKVLSLGVLLLATPVFAQQDLPANPEPGKCYVRCTTPDVYENQEVVIQTSPAYKTIKVIPATYAKETEQVIVHEGGQSLRVVPAIYEKRDFLVETLTPSSKIIKSGGKSSVVTESLITDAGGQRLEVIPAQYAMKEVEVVVEEASQRLEVIPAQYEMQTVEVVVKEPQTITKVIPAVYENQLVEVMVKEASQRLEVIPATYGTEKVTYKKQEYGNSLRVIPATFSSSAEVVEVKSKSANWQMSERAPDCASSDPNDCRYWCYKEIPAQFKTIRKTVLSSDASVVSTPDCNLATSKSNCGDATYTKTVMLTPPSTRVVEIPAITKKVKKRVMVTPPTTEVIEIPAVTKTFKKRVMVSPPSTRVVEIPALTKIVKKRVMVSPPSTRVVEIPAKSTSYKKTVFSPVATEVVAIPGKSTSFTKTVMVTPPTTEVLDVSKKMGTITKTVLTAPAKAEETLVEAKYKTITKEVLKSKGGLTTWKEVECSLLEYTDLNINWNLGSATLTSEAKAIIDARLLTVLNQNEGSTVEVASHTDARGSKEGNQVLSERRAQAVSSYLISKGINPSRLVSNGYGESRLLNRCEDGVSCTEREHRANRRTQFRLINAN